MLKLLMAVVEFVYLQAATFGWLCVETHEDVMKNLKQVAATFGWLCVETAPGALDTLEEVAATFGWLCVETSVMLFAVLSDNCSHLRVAVC